MMSVATVGSLARPYPYDHPDTKIWHASIRGKLTYSLGKSVGSATEGDWFVATALAVRDAIIDRWLHPDKSTLGTKKICYLSIEYLLGRLLFDAVTNLNLMEPIRTALSKEGIDLDRMRECEADPALGNGGLGRLAACLMDSMASLKIPAIGYGIRYKYGLFKQSFADGFQQERPDDWLANGNPWEFERPELGYPVSFGGWVEYVGKDTPRAIWYPTETVTAIAYETPIVGWRGQRVNALRLWSARSKEPVTWGSAAENAGAEAAEARRRADALCASLYPSDATAEGRELRLRQEYFFTAASLQDIVAQHLCEHDDLTSLPEAVAIQLNDTHPAIAVAERMRSLGDEHVFRRW